MRAAVDLDALADLGARAARIALDLEPWPGRLTATLAPLSPATTGSGELSAAAAELEHAWARTLDRVLSEGRALAVSLHGAHAGYSGTEARVVRAFREPGW